LIAAASKNGHRLLAKAVHNMFSDRFVYLGKVTGFYMFRAPRWESISEGVEEFVRVLNNDVHAAICEAVEELRAKKEIAKENGEGGEENGGGGEENGEESGGKRRKKTKDVDVLHRMLAVVGRIQFKIELRSLYKHDPNPARWLSRLDGDDMLLGCEDCVYDFREKRFREGRPEDMVVSMSTGHTRADLEANEGLTEEVMRPLETCTNRISCATWLTRWRRQW
jgi:hypothetical protein